MARGKKTWFFVLVVSGLLFGMASLVSAGRQDSGSSGVVNLDYEYFKAKVEPIFLAKRPGHARCVTCHVGNGTPLKLVALSPGATTWDEDQSRKNFEAVKAVVVAGSMDSPLLVHPLAEKAGGDLFHSGGKHFASKTNPEWVTLKNFVDGAKLK